MNQLHTMINIFIFIVQFMYNFKFICVGASLLYLICLIKWQIHAKRLHTGAFFRLLCNFALRTEKLHVEMLHRFLASWSCLQFSLGSTKICKSLIKYHTLYAAQLSSFDSPICNWDHVWLLSIAQKISLISWVLISSVLQCWLQA